MGHYIATELSSTGVTNTEFGYLGGVTSDIQTQINTKQVTITGAATTIDTEDLTVSRALISNASGKVDVSDVTSTELGYLDGVTSAIQTQLDSKHATITGAATTIDTEDLTVSRALISNASGKVAVSDVTSTELGYLDGVTSAIQTQIDSKHATLTFGITDTNAVKIDGSSAADDSYARFTASGIEGRTTAQLKSDIGLNNVTNESKTTMFDTPTFINKVTMTGDVSMNQELSV